jgi:hypothetical protein
MKWEGTPLVILHGHGGLSNFDAVASYFSDKGYKIVIRIYIHSKYFKKRKSFAKYVKDFITFKGFDRVILNSRRTYRVIPYKMYPEKVAGLVVLRAI